MARLGDYGKSEDPHDHGELLEAYREWSARGVKFLTEPKDHGREIRAYSGTWKRAEPESSASGQSWMIGTLKSG